MVAETSMEPQIRVTKTADSWIEAYLQFGEGTLIERSRGLMPNLDARLYRQTRSSTAHFLESSRHDFLKDHPKMPGLKPGAPSHSKPFHAHPPEALCKNAEGREKKG